MSLEHTWKSATGLGTVLAAAAVLGGAVIAPQFASAADQPAAQVDDNTAQRIANGYTAAPVPLDLTGKDPQQVGLGSYIVNVTGVCNHCHSVNQYFKAVYPQNYATQSGNPYLLHRPAGPYKGGIVQGKATFMIDHTTYLAGGQNFGQFDSKNLTPNPDARVANPTASTPTYPGGDLNWKVFWGVLHNGTDIDQLVTQCSSGTTGPAGCVNAPTNAIPLQVMPWPLVRQLTDADLNAVWQYLGAIPCNTNLKNQNGPNGSNIVNTYGGGVLGGDCPFSSADRFKHYQYVNGKVLAKS
jgi:hypothetical protein